VARLVGKSESLAVVLLAVEGTDLGGDKDSL
jgi:hypothetical protein